jgi:hypothetical protein
MGYDMMGFFQLLNIAQFREKQKFLIEDHDGGAKM